MLVLCLQHLLENFTENVHKYMAAMPSTVRLLVISDTHSIWPYTPSCPAPPCDVLIHCGDLTQVGGLPAYKNAMQDIRTVDAELKLIIAGNHDVDLDEAWVRKNAEDGEDGEEDEDVDDSRKCVELMKSHEKEGVYYLDEGRHEFKLKDGKRISLWASPYTPEFNGYAFAYEKEENRFRDIPKDIDVLVTHGPPSFTDEGAYSLDVNVKGERCGCKMLGDAVKRVKPRLHCFGHVHEGRGAVDVQWFERGDGDERVEIIPDDGAVLSIIKEEKRTRSVLVNAAVWGERKGWTIDLGI
jgi:Icc-related predicted phosphoesterase